eukprot:m.1010532 g.1010532  ORF g.1010532 m.1010532 type:complete len:1024 (+) comp24060_c0_seq2:222-3293(+)
MVCISSSLSGNVPACVGTILVFLTILGYTTLVVASHPQNDFVSEECVTEIDQHYDSKWNLTALRVCKNASHPEKVCIVGAGTSGIHMGWLLHRRGYHNTVVFEAGNRTGGKVYTLTNGVGDGVTREAGAAFLSPDYVEFRAMINRYRLREVPMFQSSMIRAHTTESNGSTIVQTTSDWLNTQLAMYTNSTDSNANKKALAEALNRYYAVHAAIFGEYDDRQPPRPPPERLAQINGTMLAFLDRNNLAILKPFMYEFFTMQGMGVLGEMPAYYPLRWASPASLRVGGFGNDPDAPVAMVREGFGAVIDGMIAEENLTVHLNTRIVSISRKGARHGESGDDLVDVEYVVGSGPVQSTQCDMIVLSGAVPKYVRGSVDGTTAPILHPPSPQEHTLFGQMQPMQFLVTVAEFEKIPDTYHALEYWPAAYEQPSAVIVRRNIEYAETNQSSAIGGVQSYSYWPYPISNRSTHWAGQQQWMQKQGFKFKSVKAQYYSDEYYYHYSSHDAILQGLPWQVTDLQLLPGMRTLYVGGTASYETVEDSVTYNLYLVDRFFDRRNRTCSACSPTRSAGARADRPATRPARLDAREDSPAVEQLVATVNCSDRARFLAADNESWTAFLRTQPAFLDKLTLLAPSAGSGSAPASCRIHLMVLWASRRAWKSIPAATLEAVQASFVRAYGADAPVLAPFPTAAGLDVAVNTSYGVDRDTKQPLIQDLVNAQLPVLEMNFFQVNCSSLSRFVAADNATWTQFVSHQVGFRRRLVLVPPPLASDSRGPLLSTQCTAWTITEWETEQMWKSLPVDALMREAAAFATVFGENISVHRYPTADGLVVARDQHRGPHHPHVRLPALSGIDVVAYFSLPAGAHDVMGSPAFTRELNATPLLPGPLQPLHPDPYVFWFSTEANARAFEDNPWKYIPANGGHCTHGISTRGDLTPSLLVDGRVAFTCVNTTKWHIVDGRLYMNSCGMDAGFVANTTADIATSAAQWTEWFGAPHGVGPINDACLQDGGRYDGNPIGHLIPDHCVVN